QILARQRVQIHIVSYGLAIDDCAAFNGDVVRPGRSVRASTKKERAGRLVGRRRFAAIDGCLTHEMRISDYAQVYRSGVIAPLRVDRNRCYAARRNFEPINAEAQLEAGLIR